MAAAIKSKSLMLWLADLISRVRGPIDRWTLTKVRAFINGDGVRVVGHHK
jgi:hypothetical protein